MRALVIPIVALGIILGILYFAWLSVTPSHEGYGPGGDTVLVIYDVPKNASDSPAETVSAYSLVQLLCHFKVSIKMVSTEEYKKGMASEFSYVFYIGTKPDQPLQTYLLDDLYNSTKSVMWIGANLDRLQARHSMEKFGFKLTDEDDSHLTNEVEYKNTRLAKVDLKTFSAQVTQPANIKIKATARFVDDPVKPPQNGMDLMPGTPEKTIPAQDLDKTSPLGEKPLPPEIPLTIPPTPETSTIPQGSVPKISLPWILQSNTFWYVAGDPLAYAVEGGAYLAFADVLYDFLHQEGMEEHYAFVRLEDIHAKRDDVSLKKAADLLHSKGIPFSFTLTPVYKNPATDETIYLSEDEPFLNTIHYLIQQGGLPILHGYTHQFSGETAVDFEFWDPYSQEPISGNDPVYASTRIERALSECFLNDIYPVAWTTPHYAAGQKHYKVFADYFTTAVERRMPVELYGSDQFFPYMILSDMHRQIIIPETLGYVNPDAGRGPKELLIDAKAMKVVREGWASFFFHTFLDLKMLTEIVDGLQAQGYKFVSLADYNNKVTTKDRVVSTGIAEVQMKLESQYKHEKTLNSEGRLVEENYSLGTVSGQIDKYVSLHKGDVHVVEGTYRRPQLTYSNLHLFRPALSGVSSPISIALLFIGMMTLVTFLFIWIYLISRKTLASAKSMLSVKKEEGD